MYQKLKPMLYILLAAIIAIVLSILFRFIHCPIASVVFSVISGAILITAVLFFIVAIVNSFFDK